MRLTEKLSLSPSFFSVRHFPLYLNREVPVSYDIFYFFIQIWTLRCKIQLDRGQLDQQQVTKQSPPVAAGPYPKLKKGPWHIVWQHFKDHGLRYQPKKFIKTQTKKKKKTKKFIKTAIFLGWKKRYNGFGLIGMECLSFCKEEVEQRGQKTERWKLEPKVGEICVYFQSILFYF